MSIRIKITDANRQILHDLVCVDCSNPFQVVGSPFDVMALQVREAGDIPCARCERLRLFRPDKLNPWER